MSSAPIRVPHYIGGRAVRGSDHFESLDPYRGVTVATAPGATAAEVDGALAAATAAAPEAAALPALERAAILRRAAALIEQRADEIGEVMARETGKALKDAQAEVRRSQDTVSLSAEEAIRIEGEHVPLDGSAMGAGKIAFLLRFPVGVVAAITPFNAPFNLACHKIAPAFAAGNVVVLKAPPQCPLVLDHLVRLFHDAGMPPGFLSLLHGGAETGRALVRDPRATFITFTGSSRAGAEIRAMAGLRRVALELGGNGPTIVCEDADPESHGEMLARNASRLAGQSCISVQNIIAHEAVAGALEDRIAAAMQRLRVGDPLDPSTDVGTLIDETAARRVERWVGEAVAAGARLVTGGHRQSAAFTPTLLAAVNPAMRVFCDEVFGPVAGIVPFSDLQQAIDLVNSGPYGLQCGVLTHSTPVAIRLARGLRTGGVIINGSSTWRTDQLAYGGVRDSGIGREGPRYAIRDMTEQRLVLFNY